MWCESVWRSTFDRSWCRRFVLCVRVEWWDKNRMKTSNAQTKSVCQVMANFFLSLAKKEKSYYLFESLNGNMKWRTQSSYGNICITAEWMFNRFFFRKIFNKWNFWKCQPIWQTFETRWNSISLLFFFIAIEFFFPKMIFLITEGYQSNLTASIYGSVVFMTEPTYR